MAEIRCDLTFRWVWFDFHVGLKASTSSGRDGRDPRILAHAFSHSEVPKIDVGIQVVLRRRVFSCHLQDVRWELKARSLKLCASCTGRVGDPPCWCSIFFFQFGGKTKLKNNDKIKTAMSLCTQREQQEVWLCFLLYCVKLPLHPSEWYAAP